MTMLVVTHEMHFAMDVADRIVFMDEGRIVGVGPTAGLPLAERAADAGVGGRALNAFAAGFRRGGVCDGEMDLDDRVYDFAGRRSGIIAATCSPGSG